MKRNFILLTIVLSFFGKAFSQPCPATLYPTLNWTQNNVVFDTVGLWNTYPGLFLASYTGEEKVMSFYSPCEAVLQIVTENYLPSSGYFKVLYKQHQATCSTQNFVTTPYETYYTNRVDYLIPVDSGVYYDIVFDYQPYNLVPKVKGNINIGLYYSSVDSINFFNIYPDSVSIAWSSKYRNVEIKYGPDGLPLVSTIAQKSPVTITGLSPDTKYNFYLRPACDTYSSYKNVVLKTPPVCASTPMISCDNAAFYPTMSTAQLGSFSLPGCAGGSCMMNQSQIINRFIPDTSGTFGINHVTTAGTGIRRMGVYYKDAALGCNEKNWNFIQCGTDQNVWGGNMGPLIANHTYYVLFSTSTCYPVGNFLFNGFKLTCPSPLCSSPATSLSSSAPGNTVCSGKPVSLFPNGSVIGSTGLCNWYQDSCSGTPISHSKNMTIFPTVSKTYFLQISDSCNTFSCDSITILVNQNPTCSITGSGTICSGSTTQWCAPAGLNSYLWSTGSTTQCITVGTGGTYTVTVTNGTGCNASSSKTLTVNTVSSTITGSGTICPGNSTQWCATSGLPSYLWSTGSTSQCITLSVEGTYTLTVTGTNGCTQSYTGLLSIPVPNCSITGSAAICSGTSAAWFAPANHSNSFLWSNGVTNSGTYVNASGTYTVTVTNPQGCSSTCSKSLSVNPNPSCSLSGIGSICAGNSAQWCATAGFTSYLWTGGATTQCRTISSSGNYIVTVTDANGCTSTCTKAMAFTNPGCSIGGSGIYACSGNSVQWCASAGLASYLWSNGSTTQCVSLNTAGIYTVTVADASGCSSTCSATVFSGQTPACSITGNGTICPGSSGQWCAAPGMTNYFWSTGATTQCISVNTAGTYTVNVNSNGCLNNCSKTLIIAPPTCSITGSGTTCSGGSTQWCAPAGLGSYLWSTGSTAQCTTLSSAGIYTVTVTDVSGCSSTCSKTLIIAPPTCSITGSGTICSGSPTQWCAPAGLSSYLWSTSATTQCVTLNAAGSYTVSVTDANGCSSTCSKTLVIAPPICSITGSVNICSGSSTQWCAPAGLSSYVWNTGATTQCITLNTAGTYTVTVTDAGGCSSTCSKTLTVNTNPVCSITGSGTICSGSSTQWCAPAGLTSYLWSTGATTQCRTLNTSGTYTVTVTNSAGCSSSCTKKLTVGGKPAKPGTITATGGNTKVCPGDSKTYSISAVPGAVSYTWTPPAGGVIVSGQGTISVSVNFTGGFVASDSLKVAAVNSCNVTGDYRALKIPKGNLPARPSVITGPVTGVCDSSGVSYSVTNVAGVTYDWTTSSYSPIAGGQGTSSITVDFIPGYTSSYIGVKPGNGCGTGAGRNFVVNGIPPKPGNIAGATTVCANQFGVPYSIAPIADAVTYTWIAPSGSHINDGTTTSAFSSITTTSTNVTINYGTTAGIVKVKANNSCGQSGYKSITVAFNCREANTAADILDATLFPNPADEELTVSFNSVSQSSYSIKLNDMIGKTMLTKTGVSDSGENSFKLSLEDITPGVYLVEIKNGDMNRVMKLVVN